MHTIRRLSGPYGAGGIDVTERSKEKRITGSVVVRMLEILILSAAVSIGCLAFLSESFSGSGIFNVSHRDFKQ